MNHVLGVGASGLVGRHVAAARACERLRPLLVALALFDVGLGGLATFFPSTYLALLHPYADAGGPAYLLQRTGVLWLFFALAEGVAAVGRPRPSLFAAVGLLRVMDVPADLVYFLAAPDLGRFGHASLPLCVAFNLFAGVLLLVAARRLDGAVRSTRQDASSG